MEKLGEDDIAGLIKVRFHFTLKNAQQNRIYLAVARTALSPVRIP